MTNILFLMAEVVRRNFADPEERRWRLRAAFLLLAGRGKTTAADEAAIDKELGK